MFERLEGSLVGWASKVNEDVLTDDGRDELDWDEGGERVREGCGMSIEVGLEVCEAVILFVIMEELFSGVGHDEDEDRFRFIAMVSMATWYL